MSEALHRIAMSDIRETFIEAFRDVALEEAARDTGSFVSLTAEGRSTVDSHAGEMFDAALAAHDREVKADALREMARQFQTASNLGTGERDAIAAQFCLDRADRIESQETP